MEPGADLRVPARPARAGAARGHRRSSPGPALITLDPGVPLRRHRPTPAASRSCSLVVLRRRRPDPPAAAASRQRARRAGRAQRAGAGAPRGAGGAHPDRPRDARRGRAPHVDDRGAGGDRAVPADRSCRRRPGAEFAAIAGSARAALADMRRLLGVLRSETDARPDRAAAGPGRGAASWSTAARRAGVPVTLHGDRARTATSTAPVGLAAYRIVQEALANAARHAPGAAVRVAVDARRRPVARAGRERRAGRRRRPPAPAGARARAAGMRERADAARWHVRRPGPTATAGYAVAADAAVRRGRRGGQEHDQGADRRRPGDGAAGLRRAARRPARPAGGRRRRGRRGGGRGDPAARPGRGADGHPDAGAGRPRGDPAAARRPARPATGRGCSS